MDRFYVELSRRAQKEYSKLEEKLKGKIKEAIDRLAEEPVPVHDFDVEKLSGTDSEYRIRIQTRRIKYSIEWESKKILVYGIERKKDRTYK